LNGRPTTTFRRRPWQKASLDKTEWRPDLDLSSLDPDLN